MIESIQQTLKSHLISGSAMGVSVLLIRDNKTIVYLTFGESEPDVALRDDAMLLWLSTGKPLTAVAIAMLYERGMLAIDDPVARYIPEFAAKGKSEITLGHLLTHTAGLHKSLPAVWESADWATLVAGICAAPIASGFVPGEMAAYDPAASWFVLGEIIQRISGQSFEDFMRRNVFTPANMPRAAYGERSEVSDSRSQISDSRSQIPDAEYSKSQISDIKSEIHMPRYYNTISGHPHLLPWSTPGIAAVPRPGASLRAPISELAGFYEALVSGRLIRPETLHVFTSPSRGKILDKTFGQPLDWGLGLMVNNGPGTPYNFGEAASNRAFGHGGQQSSLAFYDPESATFFAVNYNGLCGELQHNLRMRELLESME